MKIYLITLSVGLLVGVIYGLLNVRSPAPPVIALVGLLGILAGEQLPALAKRVLAGHGMSVATLYDTCWHHVFGPLPARQENVDAGRDRDKGSAA
jgi:XapX domain-containing protein